MTEVSSFILKCLKSSKMGQIRHFVLDVHTLFYDYNIFLKKKVEKYLQD